MDAWAKSGIDGSAERAQAIHDNMIRMHMETGDPEIAPHVVSYNTLLSAWTKAPLPYAAAHLEQAERVLQEMIHAWNVQGKTELKPDATTFAHLIHGYSNEAVPNIERALQLFQQMDELEIEKTYYIYGALQNTYARSQLPDAPFQTMTLLQEMLNNLRQSDGTNLWLKPTVINFNTVLNACSRSPSIAAAHMAKDLLDKMDMSVDEGGYDVDPDRLSYVMALYSCASCPNEIIGAPMAQEILQKMERRAMAEMKQQRDSQSMAPLRVTLGTEGYNAVLSAWARSGLPQSVTKTLEIIERMKMLASQEGFDDVWPNRRSYNSVLNAMVRTTMMTEAEEMAKKATDIVKTMWILDTEGKVFCKPDSYSYTAILILHQKSLSPNAAQNVDEMIREMEQRFEDGMLENPPDVVHYTIAVSTWARSRVPGAVHRCSQILLHMMERHKAGYANCIPNNRTYNAFIDALSRGRQEDQAEKVLYYMLDQYRKGNMEMAPDIFSFNSVLIAFTKSRLKGAGQRAESILDRLLQYTDEENPNVVPIERSFNILIHYYCNSPLPDAPYRAEFLLNKMVDLCKCRAVCIPGLTSKCFVLVIEAYAAKRLQDGGERAERLLRVMKELRQLDGSSNLKIDATVLTSVMLAWSHSGHEQAGQKAEYHLDTMERKFADGEELMRPTTRSYGIALSAWTRSFEDRKAFRALQVLRRMEAQIRDGNVAVSANPFIKSLVINACSFSNRSPEDEAEAFHVAVLVFEEMVEAPDVEGTLSVTYGWFLQLCGRLAVPEEQLIYQMERAFTLCCDRGLVNDLVLSRLKGAAPPVLYERLLEPVRALNGELPLVVRTHHLPFTWRENLAKRKDDDRIWWTLPRRDR
jgi:pentatricopeptide repeat protein